MAPDRTPVDFGGKLRAARERRGISLRQIANATKIAVGVLEALERNDITKLPGGIFGRAFVRSYAVEVGLDPEETIQEFIAQFPHDSVTVGHPTSEQIEDHDAVESDRRSATTFLRLIIVSVPLAGAVLYLGASGRLTSERPAAEPHSAPASVSPTPTPAASNPTPTPEAVSQPVALPPAADTAAAATPLTIEIVASSPCWLSATVDGQKRIERLLAAGERQRLEVRRELVLIAGDAGALSMTINGAPAKPLGKTGEVVTMRVNPANMKSFLASR